MLCSSGFINLKTVIEWNRREFICISKVLYSRGKQIKNVARYSIK